MRMRSPDGKQFVRVADTAGHTFIVGKEWTEVPERFRRGLVAEGAVIEGMEGEQPDPGKSLVSQDEIVLQTISTMVDEGKADEFGNDGKPKIDAISKRAGFSVTRHMRDKAWETISS
jgi:hypothetical protein